TQGPQAGITATATTNSPSPLGLVKHFQYPKNSFDPLSNNISLSSYGSPSDLWGRMAVGLDFRGQPLFWKSTLAGNSTTTWAGELRNNPYDINLPAGGTDALPGGTPDNPFSVFDLERVLRQFDIDSSNLNKRLWNLCGAGPAADNYSGYGFPTAAAAQTF